MPMAGPLQMGPQSLKFWWRQRTGSQAADLGVSLVLRGGLAIDLHAHPPSAARQGCAAAVSPACGRSQGSWALPVCVHPEPHCPHSRPKPAPLLPPLTVP